MMPRTNAHAAVLPGVATADRPDGSAVATSRADSGGARVLVIDDDPAILRALTRILRAADWGQ